MLSAAPQRSRIDPENRGGGLQGFRACQHPANVQFLDFLKRNKVARLHLEKIGVKLTTLTKQQADYLGVPVEGPYKPDHYRY